MKNILKKSVIHGLATGSDIVLGHLAKIPACTPTDSLFSHVSVSRFFYDKVQL